VKKKNCKGRQWEVQRRKWRRINTICFQLTLFFEYIRKAAQIYFLQRTLLKNNHEQEHEMQVNDQK